MGYAIMGVYDKEQEAIDALPELMKEFPRLEKDGWVIFKEEDGTFTVCYD